MFYVTARSYRRNFSGNPIVFKLSLLGKDATAEGCGVQGCGPAVVRTQSVARPLRQKLLA